MIRRLAELLPVGLDTGTMSLQRVFESARKFGVPVIITDPAGREPLVVMPLDRFEVLQNGLSVSKTNVKELNGGTREKSPSVKTLSDDLPVESNIENPLDERFYFEPIEDN